MKRTMLTMSVLAVLAATAFAGDAPVWQTDYEKAAAQAAKENKYMLLDFTGSDWCIWCIRLQKEVFSQEEFKTYAADKLVLVLLDFPREKRQSEAEKKQNKELMEKYEVKGYPTIVILSPKGDLVAKTGYRRGGAAKYVEHLQALIAEYEKRAGSGAEKR